MTRADRLPVNSPQVTTVGADLKQFPIEVLLTVVSATEEPVRCVRSVLGGNVTIDLAAGGLGQPAASKRS